MTFCPRLKVPNDCTPITLEEVIDAIRTGALPIYGSPKETVKDLKRKIDNTNDAMLKDMYKDSLPLFVAAGEFNHRSVGGLDKYSQYIIADFDYKTSEDMLSRDADWERFKTLPYVRVMFTSPRGGIKLIIRHNNDDDTQHKNLMSQIKAAINSNKWDSSGSDPSRACFFSYDPDLYENQDCDAFEFEPVTIVVPIVKSPSTSVSVSSTPAISVLSEPDEMQVIKRVQSWSDANFPICRGYRHNHLHMFAQRLKENGVSKQAATEYLILKYIGMDKGDELTGAEIMQLVENGYR